MFIKKVGRTCCSKKPKNVIAVKVEDASNKCEVKIPKFSFDNNFGFRVFIPKNIKNQKMTSNVIKRNPKVFFIWVKDRLYNKNEEPIPTIVFSKVKHFECLVFLVSFSIFKPTSKEQKVTAKTKKYIGGEQNKTDS